MKLRDYGIDQPRDWFQQILEWSRGKINLDNLDARLVVSNIGTTETLVGHSLGRIPQMIIPVMVYPYGTDTLNFTKAPTIDTLFLKAGVAGPRALLVF